MCLCMCVSMYVCQCVSVYVYVCLCVSVRVCVCMCVCVFMYVCVNERVLNMHLELHKLNYNQFAPVVQLPNSPRVTMQ